MPLVPPMWRCMDSQMWSSVRLQSDRYSIFFPMWCSWIMSYFMVITDNIDMTQVIWYPFTHATLSSVCSVIVMSVFLCLSRANWKAGSTLLKALKTCRLLSWGCCRERTLERPSSRSEVEHKRGLIWHPGKQNGGSEFGTDAHSTTHVASGEQSVIYCINHRVPQLTVHSGIALFQNVVIHTFLKWYSYSCPQGKCLLSVAVCLIKPFLSFGFVKLISVIIVTFRWTSITEFIRFWQNLLA